jgi:hypothetical protein
MMPTMVPTTALTNRSIMTKARSVVVLGITFLRNPIVLGAFFVNEYKYVITTPSAVAAQRATCGEKTAPTAF